MNVQILIDSIVRQTTILIAELATSGGVRAPLAGIANQVFLELSNELFAQGVSRKVSADMFGMALRTYLRKIQRLRESSTDYGRSLWEAMLDYLGEDRLVTREEVIRRFHRDDAEVIGAVLHDLVEAGLVLKTGRGKNTAYRAASRGEMTSLEQRGLSDDLDDLVWAIIYREGPLGYDALKDLVRGDCLDAVLLRLVASGRVHRTGAGEGESFAARDFVIPEGSERGWEAAIFDHFQAVARTIGARLKAEDGTTTLGGSTYSFEIWSGHPHEFEVLGLLTELRERTGGLRQKVREHNATAQRPERLLHLTFYGGQSWVELEAERTRS